jgi:GNAT superfamily N-acetyltransferase
MSAAVIATNDDERPLGAAWWHMHEPPLVMTTEGSPMPELTMALVEGAHGHGIGTALIEHWPATPQRVFAAIAFNVHRHNPAALLYMRSGFRVARKGRGWFGIAMTRELRG